MFIGIGTLIFAKHPAMRSLAEVAIIGMATVVLMACYLPPIVFGWLTKKKGQLRQVPLTLKRLIYTILSLLVFVVFVFFIFTPFTLVYMFLGPNTEKKRYRFHQLIAAFMRIALKLLPGVKCHLVNKYGENFEKPAVIIANHQSHLQGGVADDGLGMEKPDLWPHHPLCRILSCFRRLRQECRTPEKLGGTRLFRGGLP